MGDDARSDPPADGKGKGCVKEKSWQAGTAEWDQTKGSKGGWRTERKGRMGGGSRLSPHGHGSTRAKERGLPGSSGFPAIGWEGEFCMESPP